MMFEYIIVIKQAKLVCVKLKQHLVVTMAEIESNQKALTHWLKINKVERVKLILDLMEEELYVDHHPSLYMWELRTYAERQQKRRFPVTDFSRYQFSSSIQLPWNPVKGELLVSGFNEDAIVINLMSWLDKAEILVDSIHSSMSILYTMLINTWFDTRSAKIKLKSQTIVMLVRVSEQDFRQLLFVNGVIRTSRQVHLDADDYKEKMQILLQELNVLEKFAKSQKMISATDGLHIYYIGLDDDDRQQASTFFAQTSFSVLSEDSHFADMQTLMSCVAKQHLYDRFLVLVLSSAQLASDYYPNAVGKVHQVKKARLALWMLVSSFFLLLIGYILNHLTYLHETEQSLQRMIGLQQEYRAYVDRFAIQNQNGETNSYSLQHLKLTVEAIDAINAMQQERDFFPFLVPISKILADYSDIHLIKLDFSKSILPSGNASSDGVKLGFDHISLILEIEVEPQSRLSDKIDRVDMLIRQLNEIEPKGVFSAQLVKVPFNVDSRQQLRLKVDNSMKNDKMGAEFEVVIKVNYD